MWNRVILLLSGVAFGWSLVHYASAPREDLPALRLALIASGAIGVGLAMLIGLGDLTTGVLALFVMTTSALVAYAANAKQVNRPPISPLLHGAITPTSQDDRTGVLLVIGGEPARYEGPAFWAWWSKISPSAPRCHWFLAPWRFGRVRKVYAEMGNLSPLASASEKLCQQLGVALGEGYAVYDARLFSSPTVRDRLAEMAEKGLKRAILVPIAQAFDYQKTLDEQIALSRVREVGMRLLVTDPIAAEKWLGMPPAQRLDAFWEGTTPPVPAEPKELAQQIAKAILHAQNSSLPKPHLTEKPYG